MNLEKIIIWLINTENNQCSSIHRMQVLLIQDELDTKVLLLEPYHWKKFFFLGQRVYINFPPLSN